MFISVVNYWQPGILSCLILFFLRMRLRPIVGQPGNSSIIISRVKLRQTTVQLCKRAGFDDLEHRLGLTTGAQISVCKTPCLSTGPAMPLTGTVHKWFRRDHCCCGRVKPGCRIVESSTSAGEHWPPEQTSRIPSTDFWCRLKSWHTIKLVNG